MICSRYDSSTAIYGENGNTYETVNYELASDYSRYDNQKDIHVKNRHTRILQDDLFPFYFT